MSRDLNEVREGAIPSGSTAGVALNAQCPTERPPDRGRAARGRDAQCNQGVEHFCPESHQECHHLFSKDPCGNRFEQEDSHAPLGEGDML